MDASKVQGMKVVGAIRLLGEFSPSTQISTVYDLDGMDATFTTLLPTFEYPDWSHKTIGEFLQAISG